MPTKEQMNAAEQKIEWLKSMRYARDAPHPPAPMSDELIEWMNNFRDEGTPPTSPSDLHLPGWKDLSRDEQQAVLEVDVNWQGFTQSQEEDVIRRVLDGEGAEWKQVLHGLREQLPPVAEMVVGHGGLEAVRPPLTPTVPDNAHRAQYQRHDPNQGQER
jgi:hypothetical protein